GVKVNAVIAVLLEEGEDASAIETGGETREAPAGAEAEQPTPDDAAATEKPAPAGAAAAQPDEGTKDRKPQPGAAQRQEPARTGDARDHAAEGGREGRIFASPLARRLAREAGIDLAEVKGSGPRGRIIKADIESFEPAKAAAAAPETPAPAAAGAAMPGSAFTTDQVRQMYEGRAYEEIRLDGMRRTIATRLTQAKQTIPHFYLRRDVRIDTLLGLRKTLNA